MARILFVEDDLDIRQTMTTLLKKIGHSPIVAEDGQEALSIIKDRSVTFDLIIMDLSLPKVDGSEVMKEIWEASLLPEEFPIIIWSADSWSSNLKVLPYFTRDSISFMKKPISLSEVRDYINQSLGLTIN